MASFKCPPSESSSEDESKRSSTRVRRQATLYDAIAGRISQKGFIDPQLKDYQKGSKQPLRPDEVLFKQLNAPVRYEENDYYHAHKNLPPDQKLPDSDLLSALHAYVSKLYTRNQDFGSDEGFKSMDETALIALGILVEETAKEALGETGDLALLEGAREDEEKAFADDKEEETNSPVEQESEDAQMSTHETEDE